MNDVERYCNEMEEMFATKGWKNILEQIDADIDGTTRAAATAPTWDVTRFLQGRLALLEEFRAMPAIVDNIRDNYDADV